MSKAWTRRQALAGIGGGLALPLLPRLGRDAAAEETQADSATQTFAHGVASGDPDHHSVVLWTRVSTDTVRPEVRWELAQDIEFGEILGSGTLLTDAGRDFTIKVLVGGLQAGQNYFYRFFADGSRSPTGRTRTLPMGSIDKLGLAIASCSNYPFGYFNAYEAIARDPQVDVVLHLGDYLYEYGPEGYGGAQGRRLGREHLPAHEITSLADYRKRHAQYKADEQSRAMHAAHPLIAIWDDHESANNPWMGGAENHQPQQEGDWAQRRAASLKAYFEWMPVRDPAPGHGRAAYWRHYRFGNLASLITLETRHTGRARQINYAEHAELLGDAHGAQRFIQTVVGDPTREMLSQEMQGFLQRALRESLAKGVQWQLLGNQIPMARTQAPRLSTTDLQQLEATLSTENMARARQFAQRGALGLPLYLDTWDGYPAARERLYQQLRSGGAERLLVLTGDSHSFWFNRLHDAQGRRIGLELGTTGISSPADFKDFGREGAALIDQRLVQSNAEVIWTEGIHNGYVRLVLSPQEATADYIALDTIVDRHYTPRGLKQVRIASDLSVRTD